MMMLLACLFVAACLPLGSGHDRITAGDLAAVEPAFSAMSPETSLGYAPAPGMRRTFGVQELTRLARRYHLSAEPASEICVERPLATLDRAAMLASMRNSLGLTDARVEIVDASRYPVPQGELEFPRAGLLAPPPSQPQGVALWKGAIRYGANRRFAIWARVRITVKMSRVVTAEPLGPLRPIEPGQLRLETWEGFPPRTALLDAIEQAAGRIPRRSLAAGTPLTSGDLHDPYDVMRGDSVRVEVSQGEARLELDARAEASGRRGQLIPVLNPANGKKFSARVEGAGKVSVGTHP
jgi:flagella basal body P-ring formation protein FlgA